MATTVSNGNHRSEKWQRPFTKGKFAVATCGSKSRSQRSTIRQKDLFHSPKRTNVNFDVFLQKEAFKVQRKLRTGITHDWSPLCSLTNRGSLSVLPTVLGLVFQRIKAEFDGFRSKCLQSLAALNSFSVYKRFK